MTTMLQFVSTFIREARDAVRRGDRDRALELLQQLVAMLAAGQRRATQELRPALSVLEGIGEAFSALERAGEVLGRTSRGRR